MNADGGNTNSTTSNDKSSTILRTTNNMTPLLVVYAFINRHYILDLLPEVSVIRNLSKHGFGNSSKRYPLAKTTAIFTD